MTTVSVTSKHAEENQRFLISVTQKLVKNHVLYYAIMFYCVSYLYLLRYF